MDMMLWLWRTGECWRLNVDAIVIGMNEKLTDRTGMNEVRRVVRD
jgi:hypothetical protein